MQKEHQKLPYQLLLSALHDLCKKMKTGTMYISTDDNHAARFTLNNGDIVACGFSSRRGMEALELMHSINAGKYSFIESTLPAEASQDIPTTNEILDYLAAHPELSHTPTGASVFSQVAGQSPAFVNPFTTASVSQAVPKKPPVHPELVLETKKQKVGIPNPNDLMELLQEELALYIGPLGPAVCHMHAEQILQIQTPDELRAVIKALSQEVSDSDDAQKFQNGVLARLS